MKQDYSVEKPVNAKYVCKLIGVSRPALRKWCMAGHVRSHKMGGRVFFFQSEVLEDLKSR